MSTVHIPKQKASIPEETQTRKILEGEIKGMSVRFCRAHTACSVVCETLENRGRVLLFTAGNGTAATGSHEFDIRETALLVPGSKTECTVSSPDQLDFLELIVDFSENDTKEMEDFSERHPFFVLYSMCKTYREKIKSVKTVNRTLLPEKVFPRLCIGSVQTEGPDEVGMHKHPIVEQMFFGLAGNDCLVTADEALTRFRENELLHIPVGSSHGVQVDPGRDLHYLWIDLFGQSGDMEYIVQQHIEDG